LIVWGRAETEQRDGATSLDSKDQDAFMRRPLLLFAAVGSLKLEASVAEQLPYVLNSCRGAFCVGQPCGTHPRVNAGSVVEPERIGGIIEGLRRFAIPVLVWGTVKELLVNDLRMVPLGSRC